MSGPMLDAAALLEAVEVEPLLRELKIPFEKNTNTCVLRCPLGTHGDERPSFLFYIDSKKWECKACGENGDAIALTATFLEVNRAKAAIWLASKFNVRMLPNISTKDIYDWKTSLQTNIKMLRVLEKKGITLATADAFELGFDGERITIPIKDRSGVYVNVRRYSPFATKDDNKYLNIKGAWATKTLYPMDRPWGDKILFTEGELKAVVLEQNGFCAKTSQGGATHWSDEWNPLFKGRDVYFLYDIDRAGKKNALLHAKRLYQHAKRVYLVEIPLDPLEFPHGDVCDYFGALGKTAKDLQGLLDQAKPWQPGYSRELELDHTLYPTTLAAASKAEYQRKKVEVDGIISGKDTAPYVVPNKVAVFCDRDDKCCGGCPISQAEANGEKGSTVVDVDLESEKLLLMVGVPTTKLGGAMRAVCGIPEGCRSCAVKALSTANLEDIRIIPQVAIGTKDAEHVTQNAFFVGHGIETNAAYRFQMRMYASPLTQHVVGLITHADPAADNLSAFVVSDEVRAALSRFQPDEWTVDALERRLEQVYADLETNVTRIYSRRDLHLFFDLVLHSALRLNFDGQSVKGWTEGLVIGDSGQGKSECANRLRDHYRLGEKIGDKGATVAGLIGGLEESGKRWMLRWGTLVLNDKGMVTIEEAKGIPEETIQKLTDMRSSGIAEINKIVKSRANARVRLLWISNPRSQRKLSTYNHGVDAVKELMGSLEDVRRFDMAMCVATGQVSLDTINRTRAEQPFVEHRFTSEVCRTGALFAWSRKENDVHFQDDAMQEILSQAKAFGREYSSGIPLVEPADQRLKLARLSAALALRTFSVDHTDRVFVRKCHVEVVCRFLRRIYDDPVMGYKKFSEKLKSEEEVLSPDEIKSALFRSRYARDLIRSLLGVNSFDAVSLQNFGGFDRDSAQDVLSTLTRKNAVTPWKRLFIKTPAFTEWLKTLYTSPALDEHEKHLKKLGMGVKVGVEQEIR